MQQFLTIAVPVYNDGAYLRQTLESCIHQAGTIWLYDNCSTDESTDICREYADKYSHVTHVRHDENLGAFENFRMPLFACETKYFMWLGAHDILGEVYSKPLLEVMEKNENAALSVGKIYHITQDGALKKKVTDLSEWNKALQDERDDLKRMAAFIRDHFGSKKHDSFLLHGIYRTEILKQAWINTPCVAFDDALLTRISAFGGIFYSNEASFYARWFDQTRKKSDEKKRIFHGNNAPQDKAVTSRDFMVLTLANTVIEFANRDHNTDDMFHVISLIKKYAEKPSRARRYALYRKICAISVFIFICAVFFYYFAL